MSKNDQNIESRRRFLKLTAGAAAAVAAVSVLPRMAHAQGLPHLSESDPTAKGLSYVEDASKSTNPQRKPGADCSNCSLFQGKAGDAWGPCPIFPGKDVAAKGWCVSHMPKAS